MSHRKNQESTHSWSWTFIASCRQTQAEFLSMWCNYTKMSRTSVSTRYITASVYTCWAAIIWWLTWIPSRFSQGANLYTLSSSVKRNVLTTTHGLKAPAEKIPISSPKKENSQIYSCRKVSSPLKWRAAWSTGKDPALEPGKAGFGCQLCFLRARTRWLPICSLRKAERIIAPPSRGWFLPPTSGPQTDFRVKGPVKCSCQSFSLRHLEKSTWILTLFS